MRRLGQQAGSDRQVRRAAFSLIELVTALAISSIIMAALGSAVVVASAALPTARVEAEAAMESALDRMILEASEAELIKAAGSGVLTFVVPDRNADGQTEHISYTWDGSAGSPIRRTYNKGASEILVAAADSFTATTETSSYTLPLSTKVTRERIERVTIAATPAGAAAATSRSIALPNAPPVLDLWVRTDFPDVIVPTTIDRDWSGSTDLYTNGTISTSFLDKGWWQADADLSVRNPGAITVPMTASARVRILSVGNYATIYTMVSPMALSAAGLRLKIEARSSDTRLTLESLTALSWSRLWSTDIAPGAVDVTLAVVPSRSRAYILVNGDEVGSASYSRQAFGVSGAVVFDRSGTNVFFDWIDVRIGGTP